MFQTIISTISSFMYSKLLVIILIGAGVYFTVRTRFPQVRLFKRACGSVMEKPEDTLLLCTATAMMCMSSGIDPAKELQGAPWVQAWFFRAGLYYSCNGIFCIYNSARKLFLL